MDSLCQPTHLDSPLSCTLLKNALKLLRQGQTSRQVNLNNLVTELSEFLSYLKLSPETNFDHDIQKIIGELYNWKSTCTVSTHCAQRYKELWNAAATYIPTQLSSLDLGVRDDSKIAETFSSLVDHEENAHLFTLYELREFLEGGVCISAKPGKITTPGTPSPYPKWKVWSPSRFQGWIYHGELKDKSNRLLVILSQRLCYIIWNNKSFLVTRNHFLLLSDILSQRFLLHTTSVISKKLGRTNYPDTNHLDDLFSIGDSLLGHYGNLAYNSIGLWEAICVGEILSREKDPATNSFEFKEKMIEAFINSQGTGEEEVLANFYDEHIDPLISTVNNHVLFQLFGLYRIWGHPTVDEEKGVQKLRSIACRPRATNDFIINRIVYKWREFFSMSYFAKNKKWPQLSILRKAPNSMLIKALKTGIYVSPYSNGYKLDDWKYVRFEKTFDIPEKFELSEMISDKALSLPREELKEKCKKGSIGASWERNVILTWLNTNYNNPAEFINKIDEKGFSPGEDVVGVHPKEREIKLMARLFGLLTIEKRLYVVLTEAMLADYIFPYFPEITMTFDSVTLQTRIHNNTRKQSDQKDNKDHTVVVNMDFNKWNSFMREEETKGLFRDFDHLFGLNNVYQRTHSMFSCSLMYLADGTTLPFDENGEELLRSTNWRGHLGGIEGLRQKGWTIFTVVILKYISEIEGVKCQIMGQGDNQVLIITYPFLNAEDLKRRHAKFLNALNTLLDKIGPPLKIEETWSSSHFFIYGKFPVYRGKPLSMSMKKICRTMRLTNEGFQNLESTLSSITANASAATASDFDPVIPYIVSSYETLGAIRLHLEFPFYLETPISYGVNTYFMIPIEKKAQKVLLSFDSYQLTSLNKRSSWVLIGLALQPCILGGYPTVQLCDLMNHGFPDPLSLNLWNLKYLFNHLPDRESPILKWIWNIVNPILSNYINYEMICQDPVSLNLIKASSGGEKIKRMVFEYLTEDLVVKNQQFVTFLKLAKQRQTDLCNLLGTMIPFNPRVCNSLISSTIVGRAMKIISKVNKTSTLIGLMLKAKSSKSKFSGSTLEDEIGEERESVTTRKIDTTSLYGRFEKNYLLSCLYQLYKQRVLPVPKFLNYCSTLRAQELRESSWKMKVTGVTVCVPQECFTWIPSTGGDCMSQGHIRSEAGYISIRTHLTDAEYSQLYFDPLNLPLGCFKPFFGSQTKNKVKYEGGELKGVAPPILKGILDCMCLIGWGSEMNSNLSNLLRSIFSSFTDLDPEWVTPDMSSISGSVEHRWQDMRTSHYSSISILYELLTHFTLTTNHFKPEVLPQNVLTDNHNLSFQTIFTWVGSIWSHALLSKQISSQSYHLHIQCENCIQPIYEGMLEISDSTPLISEISQSRQIDNPYCWIPKEIILGNSRFNMEQLWKKQSFHLESPTRALSLAMVTHYLTNFPLKIGDYLHDYSSENSEIIPISVALSLDLTEFIEDLAGFCLVSYILLKATSSLVRACHGVKQIIQEAADSLSDMRIGWFRGLLSLSLNYHGIINLIRKHPSIPLPKGTPPSLNEKCSYFKEVFNAALVEKSCIYNFHDWIKKLLDSNFSFFSDLLIMNPIVWACILNLCNHLEVGQNPGLYQLSIIRQVFISSYKNFVLNSNVNLAEILKSKEWETKYRWVIPSLTAVCRIVKESEGVCYSGVIDKIAKVIKGKRFHIRDVRDPSVIEDPFYSSLDGFEDLPSASSLIARNVTEGGKPVSIQFPIYFTDGLERSLINHFLKTDSMITTASYKPVSILQRYPNEVLNFKNNPRSSGFYGDGAGGYTTYAGREFPQEDLIYNTLFEVDKLSSVGLDDYIPAAIGAFPSILKRVTNLNEVIEGTSDLTNSDIINSPSLENKELNMVMCDAEGGGWSNPQKGIQMCLNILKISRKGRAKMTVFKSYAYRLDLLYSQFLLFCNYFENVEIVRSWFSSVGNTEVFLVGRNLRGTVSHLIIDFIPQENSPSLIMVEGTSYCKLSLEQFMKLIKPQLFSYVPLQESIPYSLHISVPEWRKSVDGSLIEKLGLNNSSPPTYPDYLIYRWRKELNLIRFSHGQVTHLKLNFVTKSLASSIAYHLLLSLSLLIKNPDDFKKWEKIIQIGFLQIYASIDSSWSVCLTKSSKQVSPNSPVFSLIEVLSGPVLKKLVVEAGRLNQMTLLYNWREISLNNWESRFIYEFPIWWEDRDRYIPMPFTPIRAYKENKAGFSKPKPVILQIPLETKLERKALEQLRWTEGKERETLYLYQGEKRYLMKRKRMRIILSREYLTVRRGIRELSLAS